MTGPVHPHPGLLDNGVPLPKCRGQGIIELYAETGDSIGHAIYHWDPDKAFLELEQIEIRRSENQKLGYGTEILARLVDLAGPDSTMADSPLSNSDAGDHFIGARRRDGYQIHRHVWVWEGTCVCPLQTFRRGPVGTRLSLTVCRPGRRHQRDSPGWLHDKGSTRVSWQPGTSSVMRFRPSCDSGPVVRTWPDKASRGRGFVMAGWWPGAGIAACNATRGAAWCSSQNEGPQVQILSARPL
jgi:hypothetical protein